MDGASGWPLPERDNRTCLELAGTPNLDSMARSGCLGMALTVPPGMEPSSACACMSVLGYDPLIYYRGRSGIEARSMGVPVGKAEVTFRCNLVTVQNGIMADFSAGHISSPEGAGLLSSLGNRIPGVMFRPGISYRNLLVVHDGKGATSTPPHDIVGKNIADFLPKGGDAGLLLQCMEKSTEIFFEHKVNYARQQSGKPPATQIWPWSGGHKPAFPSFEKKFGKKGGVLSAVDLLNGIARCAGMEVINVPGATGYLDTDYDAKGHYALEAIKHLDFLYLHIEAPDEAGHLGNVEEKVRAIERVDGVIGMILEELDGVLAVLPDHPTPIRVRTHTRDPVPFVVVGKEKDATERYSEQAARSGGLGTKNAVDFLDFLFS